MHIEDIEKLQQELDEARELIHAIRTGAIDALAVTGNEGPQIFTLQSADMSYRLLVEKMNEGAIILNQEGYILYSNSSVADFLGLSLKNLIGSLFFSLFDTELKQQFTLLFKKGWSGQSRGEFMIRNKERVYVPFYFSMSLMELENQPALAVIITNLSVKNEIKTIRSKVLEQNAIIAKKDLELLRDKEIKQEAKRLGTVLEGLPQMAWTADKSGSMNYFNERWYNYTGTDFESARDWGWKNVVHPDLVEKNILAWAAAVQKGTSFEMESLFRRCSDGMYRWHLVRARPVKNDKGDIFLWVGTCTDIQDQKHALEQLAQATAQLKVYNSDLSRKNIELIKTNNDLDSFLYLASHDLKAPIANIEGLLNAFFGEVEVNQEYKPMVEMMFTSVDRFKKTILDLTEISKVHKDDQPELELVDVREIYEDVCLDIKDLIKRKSAVVITDFQVNPVPYYGKILRSTIYNLLSNAIKYCKSEHVPEILLSTELKEESVILRVKDNGLGLSAEHQLKIFKMFNRIHTNEEGSGIGLYIIKRMIENVGGKIEVESEPGKGSVFTVYLSTQPMPQIN